MTANLQLPSGWQRTLTLAGLVTLLMTLFVPASYGQTHSIARTWNEAQLDAIRMDTPRPTVHARNLFHLGVVMYDSWAVYDGMATPYLLNNTFAGLSCDFSGITMPMDTEAARHETLSYAAYRLLSHRFANSPGSATSLPSFDAVMDDAGYDRMNTSTDYASGGAAELGNYIAQCMIDAGLQDGSNEINDYATLNYLPFNDPLIVGMPGNPTIDDMNRWQPLVREFTTDMNGEVVPGPTPGFLTPEWGQVTPFALSEEDLNIYQRDGHDYWVYHDPGPPSLMEPGMGDADSDYMWNFTIVAAWASHLDPNDGVIWDISPASRGNTPVSSLPETSEEYRAFYDFFNGYITGNQGHAMNPHTGMPYEPQMVPRGDYARVLAEFWADGPSSETPPGHWVDIFNEVNDHPALEKKFRGTGEVLTDLEWDVKGYFLLGSALHDVAVSVWGIKPWHDYIRPVSAIRALADKGQSSDATLPSYSPDGIALIENHIELVEMGDPLAGDNNEHVGKIKIYSWKGPDYIANAETESAGVDWILAENWWPYQQPSFITPPFAGYVSGHSTFSSAAAEVLTLFTGDAYFPGGLGEFSFTQDEYLLFENGPSVDMTLQWATYRDASDEASLSRIWGGIHPPIDDVPGRQIGITIANDVLTAATTLFEGTLTSTEDLPAAGRSLDISVYPNPVSATRKINISTGLNADRVTIKLFNILGQEVFTTSQPATAQSTQLDVSAYSPGVYIVQIISGDQSTTQPITILQ